MRRRADRAALVAELREAGFVAAKDEADVLIHHAAGRADRLHAARRRRLGGEPLAWIVGETSFCGITVDVAPHVYVPRPQTEALVRRAIGRLPGRGVAIDVCCGCGAIALALASACPQARVVATDIDPDAVTCALANGVEAYEGDLFDPLPADIAGAVDVVIGVVPYVPREALALLQRDTSTFESLVSYDGGTDGADILRRVVATSTTYLRPGGSLLLELGAGQDRLLGEDLERGGYVGTVVLVDDDDDVRGIETTYRAASALGTRGATAPGRR